MTNNPLLQRHLSYLGISGAAECDLNRVAAGAARALGLRWNTTAAELETKPTKRVIAGLLARLFDQIGLVSAVVVNFKILFQDLWEAKVGWDEPVPEQLSKKWQAAIADLRDLKNLSVPRFASFGRKDFAQRGLHVFLLNVFCDTSEHAYGAVAYIRDDVERLSPEIFIMSKTRTAESCASPRLQFDDEESSHTLSPRKP